MKELSVVFVLVSLVSPILGAAWDFSNSTVQSLTLKRNLLITSCPSSDGRSLIVSAFKAANVKDVIEEPSKPNSSRIQCVTDPVMKNALRLTINRDQDDDSVTNKADRQRLEIKTPLEHLGGPVAKEGSTFVYAWWFQLNESVKPPAGTSQFFHIFQIKSNEEGTEPLVTLSLHSSGELRLRVKLKESDDATHYTLGTIKQAAGVWTETYVKINYQKTGGSVEVTLKNSKGLKVQKSVKASTFWSSASYYRAKWGLYRSRSSSYNSADTLMLQNVQIRGKP